MPCVVVVEECGGRGSVSKRQYTVESVPQIQCVDLHTHVHNCIITL